MSASRIANGWKRCFLLCAWGNSCATAQDEPRSTPVDVVRLRDIRHVHDVTVAPSRNPANRAVLHVLDVHRIPWSVYAAQVRASEPDALAYRREAVRDRYEREMREVDAIQEEQKSVIRDVAHRLNIRSVYVEGLSADDPAVRDFLAFVRGGDRNLQVAAERNPRLRKYLEKVFGKSRFEFGNKRSPSYTAQFKARCGAPAALFLSGEVTDIKPVEDSRALGSALTTSADGRLCISRDMMEAREDAMVANMLKGDMPAMIVLGAAHDLEDNIKRASGDSCDYIRVQSDRCWAKRGEWALQGSLRVGAKEPEAVVPPEPPHKNNCTR